MSIDSADLSPKISNEYDLETVIAANPGLLGEHLFIIGRQVPVANGRIDLLAIDARGRLWVLELKHGATTASVLGQVASYARSISLLDFRALKARVSPYWHHASVETAFEQHFDRQFPRKKTGPVRLAIIARSIDEITERAVAALTRPALPIQTFTYAEHRGYIEIVECGVNAPPNPPRRSTQLLPSISDRGRRSPTASTNEDLRAFWNAYSNSFVWDFVPTTFAHLVYQHWQQEEAGERRYRRDYHIGHFGKTLTQIVDGSRRWVHDKSEVGARLSAYEPLVELVPSWSQPSPNARLSGYVRLRSRRRTTRAHLTQTRRSAEARAPEGPQ